MKNPARALVGHMPRNEAVQLLGGGAPLEEHRATDHERIWSEIVEAIRGREEYHPDDPLDANPPEIEAALRRFSVRPDVKAVMRPHEWSVGFADLTKSVLSYQKVVVTSNAESRLDSVAPGDLEALVELCLPPPRPITFRGGLDQLQAAFTITSANPNLRVSGFEVVDVSGPDADSPQKLFGFKIGWGASFIQLVEYKGRWMVRDGYHRVYGLLKKGIAKIPCVIVRARTFEETGAGRPGFFGYEVLFGDRPPLITDFLSDRFSAPVEVQAMMKVVRLRAEEFSVPVTDPDDVPPQE